MGADNQQGRLDVEWIVGFVDGEGCFHIGINKITGMTLGWQVLPEFRVVQHERDEQVLERIKKYFGFGKVTINRKDKHGIRKEFRVRGLENLNKLVGFFKEHPFETESKRDSFKIFSEIIEMMNKKQHLTRDGLNKIANLVSKMNRQPKLRYLEPSETIRQTPKR